MVLELIISLLSALIMVIPLVVELIKWIKTAIKEKNWAKLLELLTAFMKEAEVKFETVPFASNGTITYSDGDSGEFFTVAAKTGDPKTAVLTGVKAGTGKTLTASATNPSGETITKTVTVKVNAAS